MSRLPALNLDRHLAEQAENDGVRADERVLLGLLAACEPQWRNGAYWCRCPVHDERTPSCRVNERGGCWRWHCFGCGKGGDAFDLVMALERCSFREARRRLGAKVARPAAPAPAKRPEAPYVLACERRGCTTTRSVTMLDVMVGLGNGELGGGPISRLAGEVRWVCRRCVSALKGRQRALWRLLWSPGAERRAA